MDLDKPKKLLSETAYQLLLDALFSKELQTGSRVSQKDLVRITGTAIGPIRDALKMLETDGIVTIHPRSGIEVIKPSTDLVRTTYQFRLIIEKAGARQFATTADEHQIEVLKAAHEETLSKVLSGDEQHNHSDTIETIEDVFHNTLTNSLKNDLISKSFRRLHLMARVIKMSTHVSPRAAEITLQEHIEVLNACAARDTDLAEALMARHLLNAMNRNLGIQ